MAGLSVAESKDQEVAQSRLLIGDVIEGNGHAEVPAEVGPHLEDILLGATSLGSCAGGGNLQRRAEIKRELRALGRCSSSQGCGSG